MLEIEGKKNSIYNYIYLFLIFLAGIYLTGYFLIILSYENLSIKDYVIIFSISSGLLFIISFLLYIMNWRERGKEIFILYPDKLEYITENKPFKSTKKSYAFTQIGFSYNSGIDFESEEEANELGIELNIEKIEGNYSIVFFMDDGEEAFYSERKIPIDIVRKIQREFNIIQNQLSNDES